MRILLFHRGERLAAWFCFELLFGGFFAEAAKYTKRKFTMMSMSKKGGKPHRGGKMGNSKSSRMYNFYPNIWKRKGEMTMKLRSPYRNFARYQNNH
jgi:hypothetical protein